MLANILFNLFGAVLFLFIFWKRLKEDYSSEIIYLTGFNSLIGLLVGLFVSQLTRPVWWFWLVLVGISLGLFISIWKFRLRAYEIIESAVIGLLSWFCFLFLWHAITTSSLVSLIVFLVLLAIIGLFIFLDTRYKRFVWYMSGRAGFSGLTIAGVFFLTRAVVASYSGNVLSLAGKWDAIISAVVGFTAFLLVYNLSRSQT